METKQPRSSENDVVTKRRPKQDVISWRKTCDPTNGTGLTHYVFVDQVPGRPGTPNR